MPVNKKGGAKSSAKKAPTKGKSARPKLFKSLPESLEHLKVVQRVADVLEEMHERAQDVKQEASKELKKLMKLYAGNYQGLEKKLHQATNEAKKQAQLSMIHLLQKWHENKEKLPKALTSEIEKLIGQLGVKKASVKKTTSKVAVKATTKPKTATKTKTTTAPKSTRTTGAKKAAPRTTKAASMSATAAGSPKKSMKSQDILLPPM
jgi:membrane-associated HD superfamily phosphohydrolase